MGVIYWLSREEKNMQKKFHNVLLGISVLPALLVLPAWAVDVSTFEELTNAIADGGNISFNNDIDVLDNVTFGTNATVDGKTNTFNIKTYGVPEKIDAINYYTSAYTMSGGDEPAGVFYRSTSSVAVGTVLYSDAAMTQEFGTVTFKGGPSSNYVYSVDSVGTRLTLTRDAESDSGRFIAFRDENNNLIYAYVKSGGTVADIGSSTKFYSTTTANATYQLAMLGFETGEDDTYYIKELETFTYEQTGKPHNVYILDGQEYYSTFSDNPSALYTSPNLGTENKVYGLNGNGEAISASGKIVVAQGVDLTLKNFEEIGGFYSTTSGGILNLKSASLNVENTKFKNNAVAVNSNGGAIYMDTNSSLILDSKTSFENNSAKNGGAIHLGNNSSTLDLGGASFDSNTAINQGGAVYVGTYKVDETLSIRGGKFTNNTAVQGGALFLPDDVNREVYIGNATFKSNKATGREEAIGGAVAFGMTTFRKGAPLTDEDLADLKSLTIDGATFTNNEAVFVDDAGFYSGVGGALGQLMVQKYTYFSNGALYREGTKVYIKNGTQFIGNVAGAEGGALNSDSELNISDSIFTGNKTLGTAIGTSLNDSNEGGGAIFMYDDSIATITNSTFTSNESGTWGGAISTRGISSAAPGAASSLNIVGGTFENNSAVYGGAVANSLKNVLDGEEITKYGAQISGVTFTGNTATTEGGAIYNNGDMTFAGTNSFSGNTAADVANDIYNAGTLTLADGSTTTIDGGITGGGTLNIANGATFNLGTASVTQGTMVLDGTLNATLKDADNFAFFVVEDEFNGDGTLNFDLRAAGEYNVFQGALFDKDKVSVSGGIFDWDWNEDFDTIVATMKSTEEIAAENGISNEAATTVANLVNSSSGQLNDFAVAIQDKLSSGDADTAAAVEHAHAAIHPETESVVQTVAMSVQNTVANLAAGRLAALGIGRNGGDVNVTGGGVWAQGIYNKSKQNGAFNGYTRGVTGGVDMTLDRVLTLGAGYSYAHSDMSGTARDTDVDSSTIFAYGQYKPTDWFVHAMANYTMSDYSEHAVALGTNIDANYDVRAYGGQVMTGYDFAGGITPAIGVRYMHISADEYKNSLGIKNKLQDSDYMTAMLETKWTYGFQLSRGLVLRPELRYAVKYDFVSDEQTATILLPGVDSYVMDGNRLSRLGAEFGGGLGMKFSGLDLSVNYDIEIREGFTSQTGRVRVRYEF